MTYILLGISLALYLAIMTLILVRMVAIRRGANLVFQPLILDQFDQLVDTLAYYVVFGSKALIKQLYVYSVLLGEKMIKLSKYLIIKVEKRFARIVNQVKGQGVISKKGSVSWFLLEVQKAKVFDSKLPRL